MDVRYVLFVFSMKWFVYDEEQDVARAKDAKRVLTLILLFGKLSLRCG